MLTTPSACTSSRLFRWALACTTLALAACGGGGSSSAPSTLNSVVGAWKDSSTRTQVALISSNGTFWAFYDGTGGTAGFDQGSASATGTSFQASTKEYLNGFTAYDMVISAQMGSNSLTGSRTWNSSSNSFMFTPMTSTEFLGSQIQVNDLQGSWTGFLSDTQATLLVPVNSTGAFSGTSSGNGCTFSGTLTPQNNAYAYDVSLTFGLANCNEPGTVTSGVAMVYKPNGGTLKQLFMAVQNSDRSKGWLFSATR